MRRSVLLLAAWVVGCAPQGKAGLEFAALQSASASSSSRLGFQPQIDVGKPTFDYFKMRFLSVYLVQDRDANQNNVGLSSMIYLNPACMGDNDTGHCNLAGSGALHEVTEFFDFTDADKANAAINAQALPITPGDYKYVSLDFCIGSPVEPNVDFQHFGKSGACGVHSVEANPPIHVAPGATVTVTLAYDLQDWLTVGDGTSTTGFDAAGLCDLSPTIEPRPPASNGASPGGWCVIPALSLVPSFSIR
jgi:hypothetical protein